MQIYVPTQNPTDWKRLLAKASHWKAGHSAMALARSWEHEKEGGGPPEVRRILGPLTPLLAIPEFKVDLPPTGGRPSQTDLFMLAGDRKGLVAISIEGKVNESFGPTLEERRADPSGGVHERIGFLLKTLKLPADIPGSIRYQLLHRSVAAVLAATQFRARRAVMLVHSFSQSGKWFDDFRAFARLFKTRAARSRLIPIGAFGGVPLEIGWCQGQRRFLGRIG